MSPKLKKGIRWALSAAILVFLIIFARTIDWHAAWNSMRHASLPLLAAAIGVNILSILLKGIRWWLFLRPIGIKSLPLAMRATIAGAGLNNVLVANGGDAARVVFVSRLTGVSSSTVLASLALAFFNVALPMLLPEGWLVALLAVEAAALAEDDGEDERRGARSDRGTRSRARGLTATASCPGHAALPR